MTSGRKIKANRANASVSTGPKAGHNPAPAADTLSPPTWPPAATACSAPEPSPSPPVPASPYPPPRHHLVPAPHASPRQPTRHPHSHRRSRNSPAHLTCNKPVNDLRLSRTDRQREQSNPPDATRNATQDCGRHRPLGEALTDVSAGCPCTPSHEPDDQRASPGQPE